MLRLGLFLFAFATLTLAEYRIVPTAQGPVRGYRTQDEDYFVFYGIPYATAPTGKDKFKAPLPPPTWIEPYDAVEKYVICPQGQPIQGGIPVERDPKLKPTEDCLITNIYVPDTDETNLHVVVYFHGGAFQYGHGNIKTAIQLLKSKKIIVVNFNYRLGAHGFLCLGTKDIPGNAGMKDQVTLLRWVQKNIAMFGGNPNDVTIDGWSAGSSSVDLIMLSKMAKGLFHKVIPESGANIASFSIQVDPLANAKMIASQLGFDDVNNIEKLEAFYKNAPLEMLYSIDVANRPDTLVIMPCIERDVGEEMFLDDYPVNILRSGNYTKVPMLYGITNMEGIYRVHSFDRWKTMMNNNFSEFLPEDLTFKDENERNRVARLIKYFYFGKEPVSEKNILSYVQYFTDAMFGYGTAKAVSLQVKAGNNQIYLYEYAFADENSPYIMHTRTRGAPHCAQTSAVMDLKDEENLSKGYRDMKKVMRDLWLNFITTGNPVPDSSPYTRWPPVGRNRTPYMLLNNTLELKRSFLQRRGFFWDGIYSKYYRTPISTSLI